MVFYATFNHF